MILQRLERRRALAGWQFGDEIVQAEKMIDRARRDGGQQRRLQPGQISLALPLECVVTYLLIERQRSTVDGG